MFNTLFSFASDSLILAQETVTTKTVTQCRNYVYDAFLTVFLFGLALFVICKASNRT